MSDDEAVELLTWAATTALGWKVVPKPSWPESARTFYITPNQGEAPRLLSSLLSWQGVATCAHLLPAETVWQILYTGPTAGYGVHIAGGPDWVWNTDPGIAMWGAYREWDRHRKKETSHGEDGP